MTNVKTALNGKTAILLIDPQNDFCDPAGALFVKNSPADCERITQFIKTRSKKIDSIFVTLDTHEKYHIAHPAFWKDKNGAHPAPFTIITEKMLLAGEISCSDSSKSDYALNYVHSLHQNGKFSLCVWNPHCLVGTWGHNVQHEILEAINFWEDGSRYASYVIKGKNPCTEHYSALKAEFQIEDDAGTKPNHDLIKALDSHDNIVTAGEALSHCVANTVRDLLDAGIDAKKIMLLTDCSSPVAGFEKEAADFIAEVSAKGVQVEKSTNLQ